LSKEEREREREKPCMVREDKSNLT
jgi:hypothetical protein